MLSGTLKDRIDLFGCFSYVVANIHLLINAKEATNMKILLNDQQVHEADFESKEGKKAFWHSSSHLMAEAMEAIYPGVKF